MSDDFYVSELMADKELINSMENYGKINAMNDVNCLWYNLSNDPIVDRAKKRLFVYLERTSVSRKQLKKARAEARRFKRKYLQTKRMLDNYMFASTYFAGSDITFPWIPRQNKMIHICQEAVFDQDGCYCKKYNHIVSCCGDTDKCNKEFYEPEKNS